jgi:GPH family glycoside/pentoside/hexuronide:cation symporter
MDPWEGKHGVIVGSKGGVGVGISAIGQAGAFVLGLSLYIMLRCGLYLVLPSNNATVVTRRNSGAAIEGAFSAIWLFGQKAVNAFAPLILGAILAVYGWVETTQGVAVQSDAALGALAVAITLVPAGILALSIVLLLTLYRSRAREAFHVT